MNLFVYGTLKNPDQMHRVAGRVPEGQVAATLQDFHRHDTPHGFPVALAEEGKTIEGILWRGIDSQELRRLDRYEGGLGNMYDRVEVTVQLDSGGEETAWFYIGIKSYWRPQIERWASHANQVD